MGIPATVTPMSLATEPYYGLEDIIELLSEATITDKSSWEG